MKRSAKIKLKISVPETFGIMELYQGSPEYFKTEKNEMAP